MNGLHKLFGKVLEAFKDKRSLTVVKISNEVWNPKVRAGTFTHRIHFSTTVSPIDMGGCISPWHYFCSNEYDWNGWTSWSKDILLDALEKMRWMMTYSEELRVSDVKDRLTRNISIRLLKEILSEYVIICSGCFQFDFTRRLSTL